MALWFNFGILFCSMADHEILSFFASYDEAVVERALKLRQLLLKSLPGIIEQLDIKARMIGYCYGQKYAELICVLIPSQKGLKLGFNRGVELPDPEGLLEGSGKISRYVVIHSDEQIASKALKQLIKDALRLYDQVKKGQS